METAFCKARASTRGVCAEAWASPCAHGLGSRSSAVLRALFRGGRRPRRRGTRWGPRLGSEQPSARSENRLQHVGTRAPTPVADGDLHELSDDTALLSPPQPRKATASPCHRPNKENWTQSAHVCLAHGVAQVSDPDYCVATLTTKISQVSTSFMLEVYLLGDM